ncbi:hypothetical protein DFH06DRAFT_1169551 [Mycena polygramma]|nr:hypothetical protein DFH06DRAFT_1169551 [Mycena polygramma]
MGTSMMLLILQRPRCQSTATLAIPRFCALGVCVPLVHDLQVCRIHPPSIVAAVNGDGIHGRRAPHRVRVHTVLAMHVYFRLWAVLSDPPVILCVDVT